MTRTLWIALAAVAAITTTAGTVAALEAQKPAVQQHARLDLGLSEAQRTALAKLRPDRQEHEAARAELNKLLAAAKPDEAALTAFLSRRAAAVEAADLQRVQAVRAILTPAQREQLASRPAPPPPPPPGEGPRGHRGGHHGPGEGPGGPGEGPGGPGGPGEGPDGPPVEGPGGPGRGAGDGARMAGPGGRGEGPREGRGGHGKHHGKHHRPRSPFKGLHLTPEQREAFQALRPTPPDPQQHHAAIAAFWRSGDTRALLASRPAGPKPAALAHALAVLTPEQRARLADRPPLPGTLDPRPPLMGPGLGLPPGSLGRP